MRPVHLSVRRIAVIGVLLGYAVAARAQGTRDDYARAERFLPTDANRFAFNGQVEPHWIEKTSRFWYRKEGPRGKEFMLVDARQVTQRPAFDHEKLAASLSRAAHQSYTAVALPFNAITFVGDDAAIRFDVAGASWTCTLTSYLCQSSPPADRRPSSDGLADLSSASPDGRFVAYVRDHNLWVRIAATGEEIQLSHDGQPRYDYATPLPSPALMVRQGTEDVYQAPQVFWSPDSIKIATYVMDQRDFPRLTIVQSAPPDQFRPKTFNYPYPLPIDPVLPTAKLVVFDVEQRRQVSVWARPLTMLYYGGPTLEWTDDSRRFTYLEIERGYERVCLRDVDAQTGISRTIIEERGNPLVATSILAMRTFSGGREVIWSAERDGWNHFYLYDGETATLKNRITQGEWVIRTINHVDEQARVLYFTGAGREPGEDPYLRHLYRVNLDGTGLTLLTPEPADHSVSFSPDGRYFVDAYSRADLATVSVLRRSDDARVLMELERADVAHLLALGWRLPEPFKGKAADGKTDLYGLIWRPATFDPKKQYPVIEFIYTGPHSAHVPKTFAAYYQLQQQAIAELGFITVAIDGRGTALRSRAFRNASYKNLGGGAGGDDHIAMLKQMAAKYPQMDLTRVGVWGHSAGGYDSTHALLTHPELYKVAVSSAGCHDNRMDKASWNEQWMGWPVDEHYEEQSNYTLARHLKGKLLLIHGEVDENVPLAATIKLVDALVKANKDFDLLILPNGAHNISNDLYVTRRRWDYFVRHLLGVEPPQGYKIGGGRAGDATR